MTISDDMLERRLRDEAPRGQLAGAAVRRRVLEAAISGAARRRQAARRVAVAVALLVATMPCLMVLRLAARSGSDGGHTSTTTIATVPHAPADVQSQLPMLAAGFDLPNHSRTPVRDWLAREVERASGGMLTVAGAHPKPARKPAPAWNDPRHVVTAISRPDDIPMLLAKLSREAIGSRFGGGER
jgi:hypothetical protein